MPWVRALLGILGASTVYLAIAVSAGGVAGICALAQGRDPHLWFVFGACVPVGILYVVFTSRWFMERRLKMIMSRKEQGLVTAREADQLRKRALQWYSERL